MRDMIERQAVLSYIDRIMHQGTGKQKSFEFIRKHVEKMPSAQPDIVRCRDCKWFNDIGCAIRIVDDTDKPSEDDFCSFAERRNDG